MFSPRCSVLAFVVLAAAAHAQTVGLRNEYRLVSTAAGQEVRVDTGVVSGLSGPLVSSNSNDGTLSGATTTNSMYVSNWYGDMHVSGSGTAANSALQGSFSWTDTAIGGDPFASYWDFLTITSDTLAAGTAVTLQFTESFAVTSSEDDPLGDFGTPHFDDVLHAVDQNGPDRWDLDLKQSGTATYTLTTAVGHTVTLNGALYGYASANANVLSPLVNASFAFTEDDPLSIEVLTPDASFTTGSGATYAPAGSVPDGSSTAVLLGFGAAAMLAASSRSRLILSHAAG